MGTTRPHACSPGPPCRRAAVPPLAELTTALDRPELGSGAGWLCRHGGQCIDQVDRLLPAAVPPDPRERRVVGHGLHRVAQRRSRATPLFRGHHQPHLPADLGFYDLRRARGARRAGRAGGALRDRRLLLLPLLVRRPAAARAAVRRGARSRASRTSRSACAGPTRTGPARWDGPSREVLIASDYSREDDREHIRALAGRAFADARYIRVDGKPLFLVYRAADCPTPRRTTDDAGARRPTAWASASCTCAGSRACTASATTPRALGFDAAVEFQPDWQRSRPAAGDGAGACRRRARDGLRSGVPIARAPGLRLRRARRRRMVCKPPHRPTGASRA